MKIPKKASKLGQVFLRTSDREKGLDGPQKE